MFTFDFRIWFDIFQKWFKNSWNLFKRFIFHLILCRICFNHILFDLNLNIGSKLFAFPKACAKIPSQNKNCSDIILPRSVKFCGRINSPFKVDNNCFLHCDYVILPFSQKLSEPFYLDNLPPITQIPSSKSKFSDPPQ